jgi:hypothetical protein
MGFRFFIKEPAKHLSQSANVRALIEPGRRALLIVTINMLKAKTHSVTCGGLKIHNVECYGAAKEKYSQVFLYAC